jgi:multiple sugar transport system permease protein
MLTRPSETGLPDPVRDADRGVRLPTDARVDSLFSRLGNLADFSERRGWAYFLLIPSILMVGAVVVYPVASGILLSFRQMQINRPRLGEPWVGLDQYRRLWEDDVFRTAAGNTVYWVVGGAASQFLLGLIAALALNRSLPGFRVARVLILLPWLLPSVVAGHMWALLLHFHLGVVNDLLLKANILDTPVAWFAEPNTAFPAVLVAELWRWFPFFTLFLLAGLSSIPDELYDAASMDGAGMVRQFLDITIPLLQPVIVASVILRVIGLVNSPDLLVVLTNGGPGQNTQILSLYAFQTAYNSFNFGYAAAISVVLLLVLVVFTVVYVRISKVTQE